MKEIIKISKVLIDFSRKYLHVTISMIFLSLMQALLPFASVLILESIINKITMRMDLKSILIYSVIGLLALFIGNMIESFLLKCFNEHLEYIVEMENESLNEQAMLLKYEHIDNNFANLLRNKMSSASRRFGLSGQILNVLNKFFRNLFSIIIAVYILIERFIFANLENLKENIFSLLFIGFIIVVSLINFKCNNYLMKKHSTTRKKMSKEEIRRKSLLQILNLDEYQLDSRIANQQKLYEQLTQNIVNQEKELAKESTSILMITSVINTSFSFLIMFAVYSYTCVLAFQGLLSYGGIISCSKSILKLTDAINNIVNNITNLISLGNYADSYIEYKKLDTISDYGEKIECKKDEVYYISFEHVYFRYSETEPYCLEDICLSFHSDEKISIVGRNGSGKSTFIKLLCGLYKPTKGEIRINGKNISELNAESYYKIFSMIFQDFTLFEYTIKDNLIGDSVFDLKQITEIIKLVSLDEKIRKLPHGIETYVSQNIHADGISFSGGEEQKIAIARAMCKEAPIMILDEPTASLDPVIEAEIFDNFNNITQNRGALCISHRLSSCYFSDFIVVFDGGKIVEKGTHLELLQKNELYASLWNTQAKYYI